MKAIIAKKLFTGREVINNGVVLFKGGKITAIGPRDKVALPAECVVLDHSDEVVMPGMIDCHTHLTLCAQASNYAQAMKDQDFVLLLRGANNMRQDLLAGITTARIMGDKNFVDVAFKDAAEKGIVPSPRLLISGKGIRSSYGHGIMATAFDGVEEVRKAARINIHDAGADQLKLFVSGSKGEFKNFAFGTEKAVSLSPSGSKMRSRMKSPRR